MSLKGIDISNNQGSSFSPQLVNCDFVIMKASEGNYFTDGLMSQFWEQSGAKLKGLYHYSAGGDAEEEAQYFYNVISDKVGSSILALDWESTNNSVFGTSSASTWITTWMNKVKELTGVTPFLYIQGSAISQSTHTPKWIAAWLTGNRSTGDYPTDDEYASLRARYGNAILCQTDVGILNGWSSRLDMDAFYGTEDDWNEYAKGKTPTPGPPTPTPTKKRRKLFYIPNVYKNQYRM